MQLSKISQNPKILLYGYGVEGKNSEAWVKAHLPGANLFIREDEPSSNSSQREESEIEWQNYDLIIKSPGVPPSQIPDEHWSKVTSNLRLFLENLTEPQRQKIIGITGSKGKSTTAKFTHELLQTAGFSSAIIGNYGVPALDVWSQIDQLDYIVAECSSFQLYDLTTSPHYALFLSFFADHLDWHNASEVDYLKAKQNLWAHQEKGDYLFIPRSTTPSIPLLIQEGEVGAPLGLGGAARRAEGVQLTQAVSADFFPPNSTLQAAHFRQNLGPVWALASTLGVDNLKSVWRQTAKNFAMIEHRLEKFLEASGWSFYNDSIATSPDATIKAVEYLAADLAGLILDGQDTGVAGCAELVKTLKAQAPQARVALVESDIASRFAQAAAKSDLKTKTFTNYASALEWLQTSKPGAILFSPGGKSFNRFKNYAERGRGFKEVVFQYFPPLAGEA